MKYKKNQEYKYVVWSNTKNLTNIKNSHVRTNTNNDHSHTTANLSEKQSCEQFFFATFDSFEFV